MIDVIQAAKSAWLQAARWFRPQDFAWLLFSGVLIATTPEPNYDLPIVLALIAAFQIAEPRLRPFASPRGQIVSIILKLVLSYLLVGYTHGITSPYYPIFLMPVVSAAITFELPGTILVTCLACLSYFSFLLPVYVDWINAPPSPDYLQLMSLHASFYAITAFLVFEQAKAKRDEMKRTEEAAAQLAESNRSLRRAEASLRRSERLAALGQLTAGLAHELRNPLGTIRGSAEMLTKQPAKVRPEIMAEMADFIRSEVDRMNGLITSFLNFARPLQIHPVMTDLRTVLNDVVREGSGLAKETGVSVNVKAPGGDLSFSFDPDLLRSAILNLLQNAIQASTPGSAVEIRITRENDSVRIVVEDSGKGIEPRHLESIFNPFFTTKPQGVGLGLAIVSKIIDEHGGKISVQSEAGRGTAFEMILPREQYT